MQILYFPISLRSPLFYNKQKQQENHILSFIFSSRRVCGNSIITAFVRSRPAANIRNVRRVLAQTGPCRGDRPCQAASEEAMRTHYREESNDQRRKHCMIPFSSEHFLSYTQLSNYILFHIENRETAITLNHFIKSLIQVEKIDYNKNITETFVSRSNSIRRRRIANEMC